MLTCFQVGKMGSLKVKIFEEGPDTLVWNIALELNPVKSTNIFKLNSKNALRLLSQLFKENLNKNNSADLNKNGQDDEKSADATFCGEFVYSIVGLKNWQNYPQWKKQEKNIDILDFFTFELESENNEFTFECQRCHALSSGPELVFPNCQKICENCEHNLVPKNIRLDHNYCSPHNDLQDFEKTDDQVEKTEILQNNDDLNSNGVELDNAGRVR